MGKIYLPDDIEDMCVACVPVGSRVTCNPPPKDTDQDILCLLEDEDALIAFEGWLEKRQWEFEGEKYGTLNSEFTSWRKDVIVQPGDGNGNGGQVDEYNLILTHREVWFDKFLKATVECKKANALTKKERIAIFDEVMGTKKKKSGGWQQFFNGIKPLKAGEFVAAGQVNMYQPGQLAQLMGQQAAFHAQQALAQAQYNQQGNVWGGIGEEMFGLNDAQ